MLPQKSQAERIIHRFDRLSVTVLLGIVLVCYYVVPLLSLLGSQPSGDIIQRLTQPAVISAGTTSVLGSVITVTISALFGLPLAYWLARTDGRLADVVTGVVVLPLVLPPIVSGMVLLTVVGPNTLLGELAAATGLSLTRSLIGVVLAQLFVASPFVVITAKAAFERVDHKLEDAARTLGRSRFATVRRVTLPIAWPGILAGLTLAFARAIGEFGATIMLAYYPRTMPVQIWVSFTTLGLDNAFPIAVILLGVAVAAIIALNALGTNPLE